MKGIVKTAFLIIGFFIVAACEKSKNLAQKAALDESSCYKGVLVKKGICGQRVVQINSASKEGLVYASSWKDESSGKTYENVFTVENVCSFPSTINEGGEFNFKLSTVKEGDCVQCQAFTPVPKEKNNIIVNGDCGSVKN